MANIVVASVCNLKCPYCFAETFLDEAKDRTREVFISLADFEERLDFLDRSDIDEIRLIGGEPTLHPQFAELIALGRGRGKHIVIFSHGLVRENVLECLEGLPADSYTMLMNMNATRHRNGPDDREMQQRLMTMKRLGARVLPGFNIYSPQVQMDFLLPIIEETGCQRTIRVGLAQAILNGSNVYLHPKQYRVVGARLAAFARRAQEMAVKLDFDCGFVRCMFSDADLETLRQTGTDFVSRCSPILDIDLNGTVAHCFPLTGKADISSESGLKASAMRDSLAARMAVYRNAGIYKECSTCPFKRSGECSGGCLAATMRRFQHPDIRLAAPAGVLEDVL